MVWATHGTPGELGGTASGATGPAPRGGENAPPSQRFVGRKWMTWATHGTPSEFDAAASGAARPALRGSRTASPSRRAPQASDATTAPASGEDAPPPEPPARRPSRAPSERLRRGLTRLQRAEDIWGLSARGADADFGVVQALSPLESLLLGAACLLHQALFLLLFSECGLGDELFRKLAPHAALAPLGWSGVGIALLLFLLDAHLWSARWHVPRFLLCALAALAILLGLILVGPSLPWAPFVVYMFAVHALIYALRRTRFRRASMARFYAACARPTAGGGVLTLAGWVLWVGATRSGWHGELRASYYLSLLCEPEAPACLPAAILYLAPVACGLLNVGVGLALGLLALWAQPERREALPARARAAGAAALAGVTAMYVQAAVSGADSALANSVLAVALVLLLLISGLVGSSVGWELLAAKAVRLPIARRAASMAGEQLPALAELPPAGRAVALLGAAFGDWAKALLLFGGWAPFAFFLLLSAVKQRARELAWLPRGAAEWTDAASGMRVVRGDLLTPPGRAMVAHVGGWEWSGVLPSAVLVGIVAMAIDVGFGRLLSVLCSALIRALLDAQLGLLAVCAAYLCAGFVLFMCPPVPGPAVYLLGAFLIPRFTGFWAGVGLATCLSFGLKMLTSAIQQVLIGQRLGHSVAVRALVGYNSLTMRAIRHVLSQPGWSAGKLCILVGGPDWPTCVACGILRLRLWPIMLGNAPQVLNIFAITLAGGFQLRKAEGGAWRALSALVLGAASAICVAMFAGAAHYIELAATEHREALEALPRDEAVDARDRLRAARARQRARATAWARMPLWMRLNLGCAAALQVGAVWAAQLLGGLCFAPFEMTDSIDEALGGDWTNLFTLTGKVVLLVWGISCGQLALFAAWARARVRADGGRPGGAEVGALEPAERAEADVPPAGLGQTATPTVC